MGVTCPSYISMTSDGFKSLSERLAHGFRELLDALVTVSALLRWQTGYASDET